MGAGGNRNTNGGWGRGRKRSRAGGGGGGGDRNGDRDSDRASDGNSYGNGDEDSSRDGNGDKNRPRSMNSDQNKDGNGSELSALRRRNAQLEQRLRDLQAAKDGGALAAQLRAELKEELWGELESRLSDQLKSELEKYLKGEPEIYLGGRLQSQLRSPLRDQLKSQLNDYFYSQLKESAQRVLESQSEIARLGSVLAYQNAQIGELKAQNSVLTARIAQRESSNIADSAAEVTTAKQQTVTANQEIERLQGELERTTRCYRQVQRQGEDLFATLAQKQEALQAATEKTAASATQNAQRVAEATAALGEVTNANISLELGQRHMEMRVKQLVEAQNVQSAQQAQTLQNLNVQVAKYKQLVYTYENDQLVQQQSLNKCRLVITQQQGKIEQLLKQLDQANEDSKTSSEAMQKLRFECNILQQYVHQLQFQHQDAETLQTNNSDLTEQVKQLSTRLDNERYERERDSKAHGQAVYEFRGEIERLESANAALLEERGNGDYSYLYADMKENYEQLKRGTDEIIQQYHEKLQQIKSYHEKERQLNTALKYKQRQMEAELISFQQKCEQLQQSYQEHSQISVATQNEKSEVDYQRRYQVIYQMMERQHYLIQKQQSELYALKSAAAAFPQQNAELKAKLQVAAYYAQNDMLIIQELYAEVAHLKQINQLYADKCAEIYAKMQSQYADQSSYNYYIEYLQQSIEVLQSEKNDIIKQLRLFQSQRDGARTADEIIQEANQLLKSAM